MKNQLLEILKAYQEKKDTDMHGAFRDMLTDMLHLSDSLRIDYDTVFESAYSIYVEERQG